jgi:3',5'-cyclic AMP phosphodiesterase CpdA
MFTLAHLSDIHLGPLPRPLYVELAGKRMLGYLNWQRRRRRYTRDVLDLLLADLASQQPDHVAITGDLVNLSLPREFMLARSWLETVGSPDRVTVVPGNHDAYVRLRRDPGLLRWADYMRSNEEAEELASPEACFPFLRRFGDVALIGLSSAIATMPLMASGRLGRAQLARLGLLLDELGRQGLCRVLLIHHPPLPGVSWKKSLHDAGALRRLLLRHGAELALHGHLHADSVGSLETPHGPVHVVGIAAASAAYGQPGMGGRYNLFGIRKGERGWEIHLRSRSIGQDGAAIEIDHGLLASRA